ncbi:BON1-associated protein 2-like [Magnolia sinica]|uniref:BON1-associated protein 2-like n=1 Tax=Magnolia sinica TaxID=86752 RepID=UPI00265B24D3|nr:BON1-associated protein 2-like [Magnolia sinica]
MEKSRSLDITAISAEGLRIGSRSIKKNVFMTVRTDSQNYQSTNVDHNSGSYPTWNEKLQLPLPPNARSIAVEVLCKTVTGLKTVGSVNIPISDITEDYLPASRLHFLSYRLRDPDGQPNGIVNLKIRMVGPDYVHQRTPPLLARQKCSDGIAIGIPVPYGYRV